MADTELESRKDKLEDFYNVHEELGRGQFAVVKKCISIATEELVAAKFVKVKRTKSSRNGLSRELIEREASILKSLDHEKVLKLYDVFDLGAEMCLVLELLSGGELFDQISEQEYLTESEAGCYMKQVLEAINYLHSKSIVHLDIKPENIVLKEKGGSDIKLVDFGLAQIVHPGEELREMMGTPEFVAPEVINYDQIGLYTDMWAIGVLAYILLSGCSPFLGDDNQETYSNICQVDYHFDEEYFDQISEDAKIFVQELLIKNPKKRSNAQDCLDHPWIRSMLQPRARLDSSVIQTTRFKAFVARRRWQQSFQKMKAITRFSKFLKIKASVSAEEPKNLLPTNILTESETNKNVATKNEPSTVNVTDKIIVTATQNLQPTNKLTETETNANIVNETENPAVTVTFHNINKKQVDKSKQKINNDVKSPIINRRKIKQYIPQISYDDIYDSTSSDETDGTWSEFSSTDSDDSPSVVDHAAGELNRGTLEIWELNADSPVGGRKNRIRKIKRKNRDRILYSSTFVRHFPFDEIIHETETSSEFESGKDKDNSMMNGKESGNLSNCEIIEIFETCIDTEVQTIEEQDTDDKMVIGSNHSNSFYEHTTESHLNSPSSPSKEDVFLVPGSPSSPTRYQTSVLMLPSYANNNNGVNKNKLKVNYLDDYDTAPAKEEEPKHKADENKEEKKKEPEAEIEKKASDHIEYKVIDLTKESEAVSKEQNENELKTEDAAKAEQSEEKKTEDAESEIEKREIIKLEVEEETKKKTTEPSSNLLQIPGITVSFDSNNSSPSGSPRASPNMRRRYSREMPVHYTELLRQMTVEQNELKQPEFDDQMTDESTENRNENTEKRGETGEEKEDCVEYAMSETKEISEIQMNEKVLEKEPMKDSKVVVQDSAMTKPSEKLTGTTEVAKDPEEISKSTEKVTKISEKTAKDSKKTSKGSEKVKKDAERVLKSSAKTPKSSEKISKIPGKVTKDSEKTSKTPEKVTKNAEKMAKSPEKATKTSNQVSKIPKKIKDDIAAEVKKEHNEKKSQKDEALQQKNISKGKNVTPMKEESPKKKSQTMKKEGQPNKIETRVLSRSQENLHEDTAKDKVASKVVTIHMSTNRISRGENENTELSAENFEKPDVNDKAAPKPEKASEIVTENVPTVEKSNETSPKSDENSEVITVPEKKYKDDMSIDLSTVKAFDIRDNKVCRISGRKQVVFNDRKRQTRSVSLGDARKEFIVGPRSHSISDTVFLDYRDGAPDGIDKASLGAVAETDDNVNEENPIENQNEAGATEKKSVKSEADLTGEVFTDENEAEPTENISAENEAEPTVKTSAVENEAEPTEKTSSAENEAETPEEILPGNIEENKPIEANGKVTKDGLDENENLPPQEEKADVKRPTSTSHEEDMSKDVEKKLLIEQTKKRKKKGCGKCVIL